MRKLAILLVLILLVGGLGAVVYMGWNMPAPTEAVSKDITDDVLDR